MLKHRYFAKTHFPHFVLLSILFLLKIHCLLKYSFARAWNSAFMFSGLIVKREDSSSLYSFYSGCLIFSEIFHLGRHYLSSCYWSALCGHPAQSGYQVFQISSSANHTQFLHETIYNSGILPKGHSCPLNLCFIPIFCNTMESGLFA